MTGGYTDNRGASISQQIIVHGTATIVGSAPTATAEVPKFEGPGGVPITRVSYFAGRVDELRQLEQALASHETVCVVATGVGGIGKTSLAQQFAATRGPDLFPDGSAWLDATRLTQDLDRVCRRFGWVDQRELSPEEAVVFLARTLSEQRFLLVVDNLNSDVPVGHVPRPGDRCRTLVTSRERALHDNLDAVRIRLNVWNVAESLGYLCSRCERLRGIEEGELIPLVEFVGRLPLGVKLLASFLLKRVTLGPVDALAALRTQSVEVLEKYRGQNPGLVATFQSSYDDLDERQRRVLQALSVCARQTRAEVVGAVAGVEEIGEVLEDLHGRSLVEHDENAKAPWRLHDVVRMFVAAQPGREAFELTHLDWIETHVKAHADARDHVAFGEGVEEATEALRRLVAAKDFERAMTLYRRVEDHSTRMGSYPQAMELSQMLLGAVPADSSWASTCTNNLAVCYFTLGDIPKAIDYLERALAIDVKLDAVAGQAIKLGNLGNCFGTIGDVSKAIDYLERALALYEELDSPSGRAMTLGNLGLCNQTLGDTAKALDHFQRALAIHGELLDSPGQATQLGNLGVCYAGLGDIPKAICYLEAALAINEQLGIREGQSSDLGNLGTCYLNSGIIPKAIDCLQRALIIDEQLGRLEGQAKHVGNLGLCYASLGDLSRAIDYIQRALAIDEKCSHLEGRAMRLMCLGAVTGDNGDEVSARAHLEGAEVLFRQLGLPDDHPNLLRVRSLLAKLNSY